MRLVWTARGVTLGATLMTFTACSDIGEPSAPGLSASRAAVLGAPSPRGYPFLLHDPVADQLYQLGGFSTFGFEAEIRDLWAFNPRSRTWRQLVEELPTALGDAAALDAHSRKIIMYQPYGVPIETWAYDIETGEWENRQPAVQPPARWGSMMTYDRESDRVLLYGGADLFTEQVLGDLWAYDYDANTWTELTPAVSPPPHHFTALVYVPTIDRVILFGGYQEGFLQLFNDTWAYDYNTNRWDDLQPASPPAPRVYHYLGFEPATNRVVMFGGVLDESNWPNEPTINETWIYDVAANAWSQVFPKQSPSPRAWHVVSGTNGPIVLFGGGDSRWTYTNDTFLYTSRSNRWHEVSRGGKESGCC